MNQLEQEIMERVLKEVDYYSTDFCLENLTHQLAHRKVYYYLETICKAVGVFDYLFSILITKLEEKHGKYMIGYLYEILDNYCNFPESFSKDVAFAALENIALHHNRYFETDLLYKVISDNRYIEIFREDYPTVYGVFGRYFGAKKISDKQFLIGQATIRSLMKLKKNHPERFFKTEYGYQQTGENVALKVGVIAATCTMFEEHYVKGLLGNDMVKTEDVDPEKTKVETFDNERLRNLVNDIESTRYDSYLVCSDTLQIAKQYCEEAINYNPKYPKYPYLKAQVLFYERVLEKQRIDFDRFTEIKDLLAKARSLENPNASDYQLRVAQFDVFLNTVENYMERFDLQNERLANLEYYRLKSEFVKMDSCPPPQKRIQPNVKGNDPYAFISYSTRNFKRVYCDLLTYKNRGINFWYDAGVIPGEQWHLIVEKKIKDAECIICYLSEDYLKSAAILKELQLFRKYNKQIIWIDLTGQKQISKIIIEVIRSANKDSLKYISSDMLHTLTDLLDDDVDMITREVSPESEIHVDRIQKVISNKFPNIIQNIISEGLTVKSSKKVATSNISIPNEDYIINDTQNNIYIVMDGITRPRDEYKNSKDSIAYDVSKLFAETIHDYIEQNLKDCTDFKSSKLMLEKGFEIANDEVGKMLISRYREYEGREIPGSVGIVAFMLNHTLIYASFGDCMGIMVRGNRKIIFSDKQTTFPFAFLHKERCRQELIEEFVNKENSPYGYGVVNGQKGLLSYIDISFVNLEKGDTIYLVSDGISDLIQYAKVKDFNNESLEELVRLSNIQDELMGKPYFDDKTILRISFGKKA